jgi:hypothetical protein
VLKMPQRNLFSNTHPPAQEYLLEIMRQNRP